MRICRLDGHGVTWRITYLLDPRLKTKGPARHELLSCVHRHLVLAGVRPVALGDNGSSAGTASAETPVIGKVPEFDTPQARRRVLDTMPLLDSLTNEERETLATAMRLRQVDRGGRVVERGQAGRSMFVLAAGVAEVQVADNAGHPHRATVLGPGDSFGEMSLLTGAERSADVVAMWPLVLFEIDPEVLAPLLGARPALAEALSRTAAVHQEADARLRHPPDLPAAGPLSRPVQIAAEIRAFFGL